MGLSRFLHYVKFPLERGRCGFLLCEELRPVRPSIPTLEFLFRSSICDLQALWRSHTLSCYGYSQEPIFSFCTHVE